MTAPGPGPSPIHGTGLIARSSHRRGEILCHFTGPVATEPPPPLADGRLFALELEPGRWINGSDPDNLARHANHSCDPSAEAVRDGDRVALVARRDLVAGEEITFDYGFGLADALANPCRCGAAGCVGRMVAAPLRPLLRRQLRAPRPTGD
jgi:SET domain-containing protein